MVYKFLNNFSSNWISLLRGYREWLYLAWYFQSLMQSKKKVQRKEFRSVHWQKFIIASALRRIRCRHLYWDNSSWSICTVSVKVMLWIILGWQYLVYLGECGVSTSILGLFSGIIVQFNCEYKKTKQTCSKTLSLWHFCKQDYPEDQKACCSLTSTCLAWKSI